MLQSQHYEILKQLRFAKTSEERKGARRELMHLESLGEIDESDLVTLLNHEDAVFQVYAIQAIGRRKAVSVGNKLIKLFQSSQNPLILTELLAAFVELESDMFLKAVMDKLKKLKKGMKAVSKKATAFDQVFDDETIHDQIILPSLKYLQLFGNTKIEKFITPYLDSPDPNIRWNALVIFDRLSLTIKDKTLNQIKETDTAALVREQAAIMLDKRAG